ncbi:MAG: hypothetical protein ACO1SV_08715 [Fimbriimonas sp.]
MNYRLTFVLAASVLAVGSALAQSGNGVGGRHHGPKASPVRSGTGGNGFVAPRIGREAAKPRASGVEGHGRRGGDVGHGRYFASIINEGKA